MRPSLFLILLLLIPPFLLLLQLQPAAGMPDEASIGWKASNLVESLAKALTKDSKEGSQEAVSALQKIQKFSGKFAKAFSMLGAGFAFIGVLISILDDSDPKHEELLAEFNKMHGAIENLNLKFDGIKDLIKHEHAMSRLNIHLTPLQTIIPIYKLHVNGKDFGTELINYHTMNKIKDAIIGICLNAEAPAKTLSDLTNGNWHSVAILYSYLQGVLSEGIAAYTTACSLYENSRRVEKENAVDKCMNKSELLFKNYTIQFDDNFNQVLNSCIDDYKDNIKKMVAAEHQKLCSRTEENEAFAKRISKKISEEYFWVDAVVIVYNDVTGHFFEADYYKLRTCKKNVVIFMDSKPDYRNPHKPRMSNQVVQCSPKPTLDRYLNTGIGFSLYTMKVSFFNNAESNYDNFKEKTGSLFGRLAVIMKGVQMWAEPTDYNGRYYSFDNDRISIIGQLRDSSFYTMCPSDFKFAFDSGNFCQKRLVDRRGHWSSEKLWRDDGRCGEGYPLANGKPGQCDSTANANERGPCCSSLGWCGNSDDHCKCASCVSYAGDLRETIACPSWPSTPCRDAGDCQVWGQKNNADCWKSCGEKGGSCPNFCGQNSYCCRKGWGGCPAGAAEVSPSHRHTCVQQTDVCNVNPSDRVECGYGGISRSVCESRGCCFNDSIPGVKWCFHWKFLTPDMTRYGETCTTLCRKHKASFGSVGWGVYHWCKTKGGWDYCSVDRYHTIKNEACVSNCEKKGYSYYWCTKSNSAWDYCSPGKI